MSHFYHWWHFNWGGAGGARPPAPLPATPMSDSTKYFLESKFLLPTCFQLVAFYEPKRYKKRFLTQNNDIEFTGIHFLERTPWPFSAQILTTNYEQCQPQHEKTLEPKIRRQNFLIRIKTILRIMINAGNKRKGLI